jgi:tetratricopeptide (TPR) repeat protein
MKTVVVGVSKVLLAIVIFIVLLIGAVALWLTFGIRPFDRVNARVVALAKSNPDQALEFYPQVFAELDKQKMSPEDRGMVYSEYGRFLKEHGRNKEAIENLKKAIEYSAKGWRGITKACAILDIAECQLALEGLQKPGRAEIDQLLTAATLHPTRESGDDKWFWPAYDQALGRMYSLNGEHDKALPNLQKAVDEYKALDAFGSVVGAHGMIIDALVRAGRYSEANKKFIDACHEVKNQEDAYQLRYCFRNSLIRAQDKDPGFRARVLAMLADKKFAELDKLQGDMLASKKILASGRWFADDFYAVFDSMDASDFDADWQARLDLLKQWAKARPDSATAKVALARLIGSYAWRARGSGYSDTVSQDGWKVFEDRLELAMSILNQVKDRPPLWYMPAQRCALGQGWERQKYDAMVEECRKAYPTYDSVVFGKCYWLQPRWHGQEGEYESYIAGEADKRKGVAGDLLYARSAWYVETMIDNVLNETKLSWSRVKSGLIEDIKEYPESLLAKGMLSMFAMEVGDEKSAQGAFSQSSAK